MSNSDSQQYSGMSARNSPQPDPTQSGAYPVQPSYATFPPGAYPPTAAAYPTQPQYPTGGYPTQPGYPTGGYPAQPGWQTPPAKSASSGWIWALVAIVVLALTGTVVVLALPEEPNAASPTPNTVTTSQAPGANLPAADQARAIDGLLAESEVGRDLLGAAIDDIVACRINTTTYDNLYGAIENRTNLVARTNALAVNNVPEGETLKPRLRAIFVASHDADVAYLEWVQAAGASCPRTSDFAYQAVVDANVYAQATKRDFLALWNPVARRYGLPERSNTQV